jgi:hypothetical protein
MTDPPVNLYESRGVSRRGDIMVVGLTKFISEHLINSPVEVYRGGPDRFHGTIISGADDVIILKDNETHSLTYLNAEKIAQLSTCHKSSVRSLSYKARSQ